MWIILGLVTQIIGISLQIDLWVPTAIAGEECLVTEVLDGDTLYVSCNNQKHLVRLIGIDAPEEWEVWYEKSTLFLKKMIEKKPVRIESDSYKGDVDKFGRKLRYVYKDTLNINQTMLALWRAKEFSYDTTYQKYKTFKITEYFSIQNKKWIRPYYKKPFASNCYLEWQTIEHGQKQIFYKDEEVTNAQLCKEQVRSCNNGILSGIYVYNTCRIK